MSLPPPQTVSRKPVFPLTSTPAALLSLSVIIITLSCLLLAPSFLALPCFQGPSKRVLGDPQQSSRWMQQKRRPNNHCQQCSRKVSKALRKLLNSAGSHGTTQWNEMCFFFKITCHQVTMTTNCDLKHDLSHPRWYCSFLNKKRRIALGKL